MTYNMAMAPSSDLLAHREALSASFRHFLVTHYEHTVAFQAQPPAAGTITLADLICCNEAIVACSANVIVALAALEAMEPSALWLYGLTTNIAIRENRQHHIAVLSQVRHLVDYGFSRILM